jgi:hypothetical protein
MRSYIHLIAILAHEICYFVNNASRARWMVEYLAFSHVPHFTCDIFGFQFYKFFVFK